jgi:hypothetical protein
VTRYAVEVKVDIWGRPPRTVAESADTLAHLAALLPKGAQLRTLHLPETAGTVEIGMVLDANNPAEALNTLTLALELLGANFGGLDRIGVTQHATVDIVEHSDRP